MDFDEGIKQYHLSDLSLCDKVINFFNENKESQCQGVMLTASGERKVISSKVTTDISCYMSDELFSEQCFFTEIFNFIWDTVQTDYFKLFHSRGFDQYEIYPWFNLQKYEPPNGHFNNWHCEYSLSSKESITRVAAWMLYLNTLNEGYTEFFHQKKSIKPEKGKLLIWPSFYTHIHKGNPVKTQVKYIMTGWVTGVIR